MARTGPNATRQVCSDVRFIIADQICSDRVLRFAT